MKLEEFSSFSRVSREDILKSYKGLRYTRDNCSYFLYFIFNSEKCVYIGETSNIFWRIVKHKAKCGEDAVIYLKEYEDKEMVLKLEKHFIRKLKPMFNTRHCYAGQMELFTT